MIRIWSGQEAEIDARKGGLYRIGKRHAGGREAHIDIFDVDRRLRLIYQTGLDAPPSDSAVVDDFLLDVRQGEGTTSLRVLGSGVPEAAIGTNPTSACAWAGSAFCRVSSRRSRRRPCRSSRRRRLRIRRCRVWTISIARVFSTAHA